MTPSQVRRRLDVELVRRGLASSRHQAAELIARGVVRVSGSVADKPARMVSEAEPLLIEATRRFVSRGGEKLQAALERFPVVVDGRRCIDAGAATGGFTDCLLQHGASQVVAVDVAHGKFDSLLRDDPRVVLLERTNVRDLESSALGQAPFEVVVGDLSFISLATVADVLVNRLAAHGADLVLLVKPQFEVGRVTASKGRGVVKGASDRLGALEKVASALVGAGATIIGAMASPLLGPSGNAEFFVYARAESRSTGLAPVRQMLEEAVAESPDYKGSSASKETREVDGSTLPDTTVVEVPE